jgi:hypothetical protein
VPVPLAVASAAMVRRSLVVVAARGFSDGGTCLQRCGIRFGRSFLAAHGGLPLVGVKVVPSRCCATSGAPAGFLWRGTRDGSCEEGRTVWSGSSEPWATEPAWRADQGEAHLRTPTDDQIVGQANLDLSAAGAYFRSK